MKSLKKFLRDEKGVSAIIVAVAIVVIFGFAVIAIDLSFVQLAKTQLQNAADAAALAGAIILYTSNGDQNAATNEAIRVAGLNKAFQDRAQRPVTIGPGDVTFPGGDLVRVVTHRTEAAGDPMYLFFLGILNPASDNKADMRAMATATVSLVCGTRCLRPFCPPDRWDPADEYEDINGNEVWDPGEPLTQDHNGNGIWDPEFYDPYITGYTAPRDLGVLVTLKLADSWDFESEWYYSVRFPPINSDEHWDPGAQVYEALIVGDTCAPGIVRIGDSLAFEPGKMKGPNRDGLKALINKDPTAEWDPVTKTVINSAYPTSPRIIKVAAFDPIIGIQAGPPRFVVVSKIMALFVEANDGPDIVGRFMKIITEGEPDPDCPGEFLAKIHLVE
jgi:hypothetical protein